MRYVEDRTRQSGFSMSSRSTPLVQDPILVVGGGTMGRGSPSSQRVADIVSNCLSRIRHCASVRSRALQATRSERATTRLPRASRFVKQSHAGPGSNCDRAVPERLDLKRIVFAALDAALAPESLLATNTSSLNVGELAQDCEYPQRVLGLHFFNPPAAMKLVEIVAAERTSDEALARAHEFVSASGRLRRRVRGHPRLHRKSCRASVRSASHARARARRWRDRRTRRTRPQRRLSDGAVRNLWT